MLVSKVFYNTISVSNIDILASKLYSYLALFISNSTVI